MSDNMNSMLGDAVMAPYIFPINIITRVISFYSADVAGFVANNAPFGWF